MPAVQRHVRHAEEQLTQHHRSRSIRACRTDLVEQIIRQRCSGFEVGRHAHQRRFVIAPVFHELAGKFDGIPFHAADAGGVRVIDRGQHVLQSVAEFVEQCFDLAKSHQRRLAVHRRSPVANQIRHGKLQLAIDAPAASTNIHPGTTALVRGARIRIEEKRRDRRACFVAEAEESRLRMPDRRFAVGGFDSHAEDAVEQRKQTVQNSLQREVRSEFFVGKTEPILAESLGPKRRIPMLQFVNLTGFTGQLLNVVEILLGGRPRRGSHCFEHLLHRRHATGHLSRQTDFGKVGSAQQLGVFLPQSQDLRDQRRVVVFPVRGSGHEGSIEFFAKCPRAAVLHERPIDRCIECESPRTGVRCGFLRALGSMLVERLRRQLLEARRHADHVVGVADDERVGFNGVQYIVRKVHRELRLLLGDRVETLPFLTREANSRQLRAEQFLVNDASSSLIERGPLVGLLELFESVVDGLAL